MIIVIISIVFVLAIVSAIVLPMIFKPKQIKDHCDSDKDCGKDQRCLLNPNRNAKACVAKNKKFCSMQSNQLTACNVATDSICKECARTGGQDLGWKCQSSLLKSDGAPRNSCKPSPGGVGNPCGPGPCPTGCEQGEVCIEGLGASPGSGRCSLPRTWHKSEIYCSSNKNSTYYDKECQTKCKNLPLGEYDAKDGKCIVFEETHVPSGTVQSTNKVCTADKECGNGEICVQGKCAQVKGWCQIPLRPSPDCNEFTGTYTLREVIDDKNQISYQWSCLCDTNLFDVGVEGAGNCTNFVGCLGATKGERKVYVPGSKRCSGNNECDKEEICYDGNCYVEWTSDSGVSPYPCSDGVCGYGVENPKGSICDCPEGTEFAASNLLTGGPGYKKDSKRWAMICKTDNACQVSGGTQPSVEKFSDEYEDNKEQQCICDWPLRTDLETNTCVPDSCYPGYSIDGGCFCPNTKVLKGKNGPIGGPKKLTSQPISRWDPSQELYPFLQVGGEGAVTTCAPLCSNDPCNGRGKCDPILDGNTYVSSCDCDCGSEGLFCQIAAEDNKIPTGELCNIEDGSPVCCDAPDGVTKASDPKNPCVVGRLSPFIRAGLSDENQRLDNNSEANHDGNKLGFCYKPCKPSPGPGPATSNCGEDEVCVKLPKNAWKKGEGGDVSNYYCTKKIKNFNSKDAPKEATQSCYANSFIPTNKDLAKNPGDSICALKNEADPPVISGPGGIQNTCSVYLGGNYSVFNPPYKPKTASSLCCFNNPKGINNTSNPLPSCSYYCEKQKTNNPQPDCNTSDMDYSDDAGDAGLNQVLGWAFWNVKCDPSDKSCPS